MFTALNSLIYDGYQTISAKVLAQPQKQAGQDFSHDILPIRVFCEFQLPFTVDWKYPAWISLNKGKPT